MMPDPPIGDERFDGLAEAGAQVLGLDLRG